MAQNGVTDSVKGFGDSAQKLARSPLGIIALFLVLVYSLAAVVLTVPNKLQPSERLPLIYFLVGFPILVLVVFGWLVSRHPLVLYGPGDYRSDDAFVKMQLHAVAQLAAATTHYAPGSGPEAIQGIVETVRGVIEEPVTRTARVHRTKLQGATSLNQVLWVDDEPQKNEFERGAFEAIGLKFTLARSTQEALDRLRGQRFAVIISDMARREGREEGYKLLDAVHSMSIRTPVVFYTGAASAGEKREATRRGARGCTNNPQELFSLVTAAIISSGSL